VAVFTGDISEEPLLIHATHIENGVAVWPLSRFRSFRRYSHIYAVQRLKAAHRHA
jgi:hypothetical protein